MSKRNSSRGRAAAHPARTAAAGEDRHIDAILERVREARNFDFRNYKRGTLWRRIERRMADRKCASLAAYAEVLERDPTELHALVSALLIKVTSFFRDPEMWDVLSNKAIPELLAHKRPGEEVRVWCAGCASGEEAFSLAMALAEAMGPSFATQEVKVFGTDLDEQAIAHARRALYTREQIEGVPPRMLKAWFVEEGGGWAVRKEIRRAVVFGVNNLVSDAPISRLDLLLCRNVFIYLDAALQKRVLTRFHYALRRHGLLVLGKSELIPFAGRIYEPVDLARRIYRKDGHRDTAVSQERLVGLLEQDSPQQAGPQGREMGDVEQFHRDVLRSVRAPMIAVSLDGTVLFWNEGAARLWSRSESDTTGRKLTSLNLPGLSGELLIEKSLAVREGKAAREEAQGSIPQNGKPATDLLMSVTPLKDEQGAITGLVYVASEVSAFTRMAADLQRANDERAAALRELQRSNEELQSANEELETTNEELQSANEELQTTNEELQSTNEELETTNEELQSTNAELDATNRELAHRTEEMNRLSFYNRTIIRSLSAAVIVIDPAGRVSLWNLAAERLLGLTEIEAMGQVIWTLQIPALGKAALARARKSLAQGLSLRVDDLDYELPAGLHGKATLAALPISDGGQPLGAVLLFEDTTRVAALSAENARLKNGKPDARRS